MIFDLIFPILMQLAPALMAGCVRMRFLEGEDVASRRAGVRVASLRLFVGTAVAVGLTGACWGMGLARVSRLAWLLFFPLFFGLARPLLVAKNAAWGAPVGPAGAVRRGRPAFGRSAVVPLWAWLPHGLSTAIIAAVAVMRWDILVGELGRRALGLGFALWIASSVVALVAGIVAAAYAAGERDPRRAAADRDLGRLLDARLRFRAWSFFIGTTLIVGCLHAAAVLLASGAVVAATWVGALGGCALGVSGGVFGIMSDLKRVRIEERFRDANRDRA